MNKKDRVIRKIKKYKYKNMLSLIPLFNLFMKLRKEKNITYIKIFLEEYYGIDSNELSELFFHQLVGSSYICLFNIVTYRNIYALISYLKYNAEIINNINELTPEQYLTIPRRYINKIVNMLEKLPSKHSDEYLTLELEWLIKKTPIYSKTAYILVAYKMFIAFGYESSLEILNNVYGNIDYEMLYYLIVDLNVKNGAKPLLQRLLFQNKKEYNNLFRQMINGSFKDLFIHFSYFYNEFDYFVSRLGSKMNKEKIISLLKERYIPNHIEVPGITGDVLDDMVDSYRHRYDLQDTKESEIIKKNIDIYRQYLKGKYLSSIPQINIALDNGYISEILDLDDSRNLVMGYRAGNCFRINGDAAILFKQFLSSEHMRLVSISTLSYKDFAMMLVMRNGNVLIGQGIEVSRYAPKDIQGKDLYDTCKSTLKQLMDYMNSNGDCIVATIIGATNEHVTRYNNQLLPFLVSPILENLGDYYNGIYNYQCLLNLREHCDIKSMKTYIPTMRYLDKRPSIIRRIDGHYKEDYFVIEKIIIGLRFQKMEKEGLESVRNSLMHTGEVYCACNKDWYIVLYQDGTIDSFIDSCDSRAWEEYINERNALNNYKKNKVKTKRYK